MSEFQRAIDPALKSNPLRKDASGEAVVLYSMDNEAQYGKAAYSLSFRSAVNKGIICDYKVLVTVFTTTEVNDWLRRNGKVLVMPKTEGADWVKACQVANQLAVTKATDEYGISKIFSFHSSIKSEQRITFDPPKQTVGRCRGV